MIKWLKHKMKSSDAYDAIKDDLKNEDGFTLVELMVVIVIIGLLATVVVINVLPSTDTASITKARGDIATLEQAIDLYKLDNFNYPSTEQGLEALVTKPSGSPEPRNWNKDGYLPSVPKDPWGIEFQYISPGSEGPYDLYSFGADQREGGDGEGVDISVHDLK